MKTKKQIEKESDIQPIYEGKVVKVEKNKFFNIITEITGFGMPEGKTIEIEYALSKDDLYIGDVKTAKLLYKKYGIVYFDCPNKNVCCIGWSERNKKWYGWSHRAISGFIGKNAKQKAIRFADSVS